MVAAAPSGGQTKALRRIKLSDGSAAQMDDGSEVLFALKAGGTRTDGLRNLTVKRADVNSIAWLGRTRV